jgi:hypothetical protein
MKRGEAFSFFVVEIYIEFNILKASFRLLSLDNKKRGVIKLPLFCGCLSD